MKEIKRAITPKGFLIKALFIKSLMPLYIYKVTNVFENDVAPNRMMDKIMFFKKQFKFN